MNNMQFTVYDETVESQVKEIRKLVRLSMDGSVSESMASLGYKLNWGVSIPRIKELAARFSKDARLAMRIIFQSKIKHRSFADFAIPH
ncbi:MAG: hypothetical protein II221_04460, partial [Paludibacteraceae bacterium]|nr:hypothetical protein [Paludibacteraceae bacterium]